jgi:NAD(P)-dependent dehydrogenase (short-subunit alcohol dehydrogenase family)
MENDKDPKTADAAGAQADPKTGGGDNSGTGGAKPAFVFQTADELQAHIDRVLADRLERADRKAKEAADKAAEKAAADKAKESGEWQSLAETRGAKLAELDAKVTDLQTQLDNAQADLARHAQALTAQVESLAKGLPKGVADLLGKLDAVAQLEWLASNAGEYAGKADPVSKSGPPPTPKPAPGSQPDAAEARKNLRGMYSNF